MYKVKNRYDSGQAENLFKKIRDYTDELNFLLNTTRYHYLPSYNGGYIRILGPDKEVIDFGHLDRYPHCYGYRPGKYDAEKFDTEQYLRETGRL